MVTDNNEIIINRENLEKFLKTLDHLRKDETDICSKEYLDQIFQNLKDSDKTHASTLELVLNELVLSELIYSETDLLGIITDVNQNFCDLCGFSREELIGENHRIIKSVRYPDAFYKKMWEEISSGNIWSGIVENTRKDGSAYFVKAIISPMFDSEGKVSSYVSIRSDITKEVKMRNELKKTLEILNETSKIAKVGGWELDIETGLLNWTKETFSILEVPHSKDNKPSLPEALSLFTEESKPILEKAVNQALQEGVPYSLELQAKTFRGNTIWISTNGRAHYKDGRVVTLSGTIQDINERKLTELKYEEERSKSMHSAKLASLGEMSAGIAHEINNPLTIISGTVSILQSREQTAEQVEKKIESIKKSADRIARIVGSLKKFSRFSDEQDYSPHKLSTIVEESLILTSIKAKQNDIEVTSELSSEAMVLCNEIEIEQVLINLINNSADAIKDLEERWIKIELVEEKNSISLKITDSGNGISPENASHMFDPFFTTKDVGEGTGLGLSITASILNQHNALIRVNQKCPNTQFIVIFNKHVKEAS